MRCYLAMISISTISTVQVAGFCSGWARPSPPASGPTGSALRLAPWETAGLDNADGRQICVTATPARHGPAGIAPISGDVVGFALGVAEPGDAMCVTGDTVWCDGVAPVARRWRPRWS
jgi:hypothetical protein